MAKPRNKKVVYIGALVGVGGVVIMGLGMAANNAWAVIAGIVKSLAGFGLLTTQWQRDG